MEIKKGDRIPTNWRNWCKDDPTAEVVGFSYNSRTREDAIILRAYEKDHDEYSWVKGTLPQISEKHDSLYWAQGEYGTTKNLGDIPNGFQPDRRESISVPGYLVTPFEKKADCVQNFREAAKVMAEQLKKLGVPQKQVGKLATEAIHDVLRQQEPSR